jgi:hypothetical protein
VGGDSTRARGLLYTETMSFAAPLLVLALAAPVPTSSTSTDTVQRLAASLDLALQQRDDARFAADAWEDYARDLETAVNEPGAPCRSPVLPWVVAGVATAVFFGIGIATGAAVGGL